MITSRDHFQNTKLYKYYDFYKCKWSLFRLELDQAKQTIAVAIALIAPIIFFMGLFIIFSQIALFGFFWRAVDLSWPVIAAIFAGSNFLIALILALAVRQMLSKNLFTETRKFANKESD